ncbi:MAG: hypothetical protein BECKG1743D_GA0114223_100145 [Candidatus Kentron sp. G]|nr:MAG: hypothetical protein BECKG1743D_GA0114223_100145 [Candidatus Kentron sp. G]
MEQDSPIPKYKSPMHKIVRVLERGRATWKEKYSRSKTRIKYLENKLRYSEQNQQKWKEKARELQAEVKRLEGLKKRQETAEQEKSKKKPSLIHSK